MKINPIGSISLSDASSLINKFKGMSKRDQKRFAQCFNCKNLNTCTRDETDEDKDGLCKFYDEFLKVNLRILQMYLIEKCKEL